MFTALIFLAALAAVAYSRYATTKAMNELS